MRPKLTQGVGGGLREHLHFPLLCLRNPWHLDSLFAASISLQGAQAADPAASAAAARRALADISAQQAAAARSLEDSRHQIRLLKESSKLARLRRASAAVTPAPCASGGSQLR